MSEYLSLVRKTEAYIVKAVVTHVLCVIGHRP